MTTRIPLTQGLFAIIDDVDAERVKQYKWCADQRGSRFYAVRAQRESGHHKKTYLHRFILNAPDNSEVDHRDGDGLNNTRSNIRLCSRSQNESNKPKPASNTSGFKGVCWNKRRAKWESRIRLHGKTIHLGYFGTAIEGAIAYDLTADTLLGEFSRTNGIATNVGNKP